MTASEMQQLFDRTLTGDYEDEASWNAVSALQRNGNREIFEVAAAWMKQSDLLKRARAAAILAQLRVSSDGKTNGRAKMAFRDETFPLLIALLEQESNALVLNSGITALGHLYNEAAIPIIVRYKDHPNEGVRFSVAWALGNFPDDPLAVTTLISLTRDEDSEIRDWAVFGLGVQGSVDSPEVRDALLQRLSDADEDVREEAAAGLGKRQDVRLLPTLQGMLDTSELKSRVAEAASAMLGLPEEPNRWAANDYKKLLMRSSVGLNRMRTSFAVL